MLCTAWETGMDFEATTSDVGILLATSSAWEGPERIATDAVGNSSSNTWESLLRLPFSSPFATFTTIPKSL